MYRVCIAIVDAAHARLFDFHRTADPEGVRDQLVERADLVNPARRLPASELFSDSRQGRDHSGKHGYTVDDHREAHLAHLDAEFARAIVTELAALLVGVERLVICASPGMLGELREAIGPLRRPELAIDEIARDLVKHTPGELREQLADYGFLPPVLPRLPRNS